METAPAFQRHGVWGAPVPCVSLPTLDCCVYGQGAFLHRTRLLATKNESLLVMNGSGNIHGIRYGTTYSVVFGGRCLAFTTNVRDWDVPMRLKAISQNSESLTNLPLSDWIWDCQVVNHSSNSIHQLLVGLAHNKVDVWMVEDIDSSLRGHRLRTLQGTTRSISYCMNFHVESGQVAVGTVSNEILVWSIENCFNAASMVTTNEMLTEKEVPELHHLRGHKGVLHAVCFDKTGRRLASTSDDRSVRLWELNNGVWQSSWTAWGHSARGYAVAFSKVGVLSTGEDSTLRVWDLGTGACLSVVRCQKYQWIRSVDSCDGWAVTGANNGTVYLYNLLERVVTTQSPDDVQRGGASNSWVASIPVPEERGKERAVAAESTISQKSTPKKKRQRNKPLQQVIVGMEFCRMPLHDEPCLLVATRAGSVMVMNTLDCQWVRHKPWRDATSEESTVDACCMKIHPRYPISAIGTTSGDIVITNITCRHNSGGVAQRAVLPGMQHRSVQRLQWMEDSILLSFHVRTICVWSFRSADNLSLAKITEHGYGIVVLASFGNKGTTSCGAFSAKNRRLVAGDTRGNLALFEVPTTQTPERLEPTSVQRGAHGKEHVNDIIWDGDDMKVLSVGNDGCLVESIVDENGQLQTLLSVQVGSFTGATHILYKGNYDCSRFAIGGYTGNNFGIVDPESGYEFVSRNTGGRKRLLSVCDDGFQNMSQHSIHAWHLAICENRRDGGNNVLLNVNGVLESRNCFQDNQSIRSSFGASLHRESIFDACLFKLEGVGGRTAMVTGSEDCSAGISVFDKGQLVNSKEISAQASGIRAVCSSRAGPGSTLVAVGGAKATIQFFIVNDLPIETASSLIPSVRLLGQGRTPAASALDQRINAIKAISVRGDMGEKAHIVVTGESSGSCSLFHVSERSNERPLGSVFYNTDRPILSLELVRLKNVLLVLVGTTSGSVAVLCLTEAHVSPSHHPSAIKPLLSVDSHSVGTNSITARLLACEKYDTPSVRVCSVGDDQSITCFDMQLRPVAGNDLPTLLVAGKCTKPESCLSAVKGVEWINDSLFATAGYDQRLALWHWDGGGSVKLVSCASTGIGDVNCLASISDGCNQLLAIGGAGVELYTLALAQN